MLTHHTVSSGSQANVVAIINGFYLHVHILVLINRKSRVLQKVIGLVSEDPTTNRYHLSEGPTFIGLIICNLDIFYRNLIVMFL